jgi:large subunit ribosomal protein L21
MYAIIAAGGKQYKVERDTVLKVELVGAEAGQSVKLDVLMLENDGKLTVGAPLVSGAYAEAVVLKNGKGAKLDIFKYKAKKNVRKRQGHRQPYSEIRITNIVG